jgi:hypothetical protein
MANNTEAAENACGAVGAVRVPALPAVVALVLALGLSTAGGARAAECPNEDRRTEQGSTVLPDCRAYEQVTPADKDGGEPAGALARHSGEREPPGVGGARAALDGDRMAWVAEYALPESGLTGPYQAGVPGLQYLSRRSSLGWLSENVVPPQSTQYGLACPSYVGIVAWSVGLERGLLADGIAQESSESPDGNFPGESLECGHEEPLLASEQPAGFERREGFQNLFLRDDDGASYRLVNRTPEGAPHPRPGSVTHEYFPAAFLAASNDLSHIVFEEELPLTAEAEEISSEVEAACANSERACWERHDNLYEWVEGADGEDAVRLVSVLPDGSAAEGSLAGATRNNGGDITEWPRTLFTPNVAHFRHAVSTDGSRIFFEAAGGLYARENGTSTVRIDAAQSGLPGASDGGGSFMAASADGSKVFFTDDASHLLTDDTVPGSGQNLYECELPEGEGEPCELTNLTPAVEAGVLGLAGTNEGTAEEEASGSPYVYFVAEGALTATAAGSGGLPVPGEPNLYLHHGGTTTFIATLDDTERGRSDRGLPCTAATSPESCAVTYGDSCDWTHRGGCEFTYQGGVLNAVRGGLTSRVSENGRFIAFNSIGSPTGYDNEDAASELPGERMDSEIFLYDAATEGLSCASCNPDPSVRPTAPASIRQPASPNVATYQQARYPQRNVSNEGQLFFESYDALLPEDTGGALSVYEYEAGQLHLISPGASTTESIFLDAPPDGSDVFFMTAEPLLGRDGDTSYDVYDARVGGGFAESAGASPPCEAEAQCRGAATPAPAFSAPQSAVFVGPGNQRQSRPVHRRKRRHHRRRKRPGHRGAKASAYAAPDAVGAPAGPARAAAGEEVVEAGTAPHAVTEAAQNVETTSAELHGKVYHEVVFNSPQCVLLGLVCHNSAGSAIASCAFEYATASHYESSGNTYDKEVGCEPPPPYPETEQVTMVKAALSGLEPHVTYHYRLVAENERGEPGYGEDRTLMTLGTFGPPTIDDQAYSLARQSDGSFVATLSARINPHGYETTCTAQLVAEAKFEQSGYAEATVLPCIPEELGSGFGGVETHAIATGLQPGSRYRYRFLAENEVGQGTGSDETLLTFAVESFFAAPSRLEETPPDGFRGPYELIEPAAGDLQAGGHPYEFNQAFRLSTSPENPWGSAFPSFAVVNARNIVTTLPAGMIGNPQATPRCTAAELTLAACSGATQVGVLRVEANRQQAPMDPAYYELPLYNLVPPQGMAAQLGAPLPRPVHAAAHVDAGLGPGSGYGVEAAALNTTAAEGLISVTATIWGVPHDPRHNSERFCPSPGGEETVASLGGKCPSDEELEADLVPFLRNPTSCSESLHTALAVDAWQAPGAFARASSPFPRMEGCDQVPFDPQISLTPTSASADSPTGLHAHLHLPQQEAPAAPGTADLRKAVVTLPAGLVVNPSSADGLAACSPAQIELHGGEPARCPDASKIGTVEVETPLLERPVRGGVYVAAPHDNPFDSLLAIYIAVDDPQTGVVVKLAGRVEADRATGQLTTTFEESPQLPFEDFRLDFFDGPRAALKTAATCGTFTTVTDLTPWTAPEGADATPSSSFEIGSGPNGSPCVDSAEQAPNSPDFSAGTLTPQAGAYSPFVLRLARSPASQEIEGLSANLPPGLTGKLAGIPYCSEREIAAAATRAGRDELADPDCPAASEVGTVTVGAGAGPAPLHVRGHAYLAGPYRGAPLSLAIVTPAVAGPFDLGTVVVKTALYVDPETAQIHAVSGPIPTVLEGIPLDVRSIAVEMDRPEFSLNPTNCEPMQVAATALSSLGQPAALSNRFQVGGCDALPFAPKLALRLKGPTKRTGHPALKAVLTARPGEANIAAAQIALPRSEFIDQGHLNDVCTNVQFKEGGGNGERCPAASVYGFAKAETPLLDQPLEGPVYLRASTHELPDLVAVLGGQIDVVLDGRVDSVHGGIRNTFEVVPDAPVETFTLEMQGGAKGLLVNSTNLCAHVNRATAGFTGQSGKLSHAQPPLKASCKKKGPHRHKRAPRGRTRVD